MSPSDATTQRGETTRQAILAAAEQLFLAQGYNGTSMRQIAEGAGDIAVGGIYNHFSSKRDIFRALLEARSPYPKVITILESIDETTGPQMLAAAFTAMSDLMRQHYGFIQLVAIDVQEQNADTILVLMSGLMPHAFQFFSRVQAAGGIRKGVPIYALARTFISLLFGFNMTGFVMFQGNTPRLPLPVAVPLDQTDWLAATIDIFFHGIASDEPDPNDNQG